MDVKKIFWEDMSELYQHILHKRCICYANSDSPGEMLDEFFCKQDCRNALKNEETSLELQLLSSTVIQTSAKLFLHSDGGYVCKEIASLVEHVISDQFLDAQVHCIISSWNRFLCRAVLRSLTYSLFLLNEDKFSDRVNKLLDLLKSSTDESSTINLLNLFELIMDCSLKSVHVLEPYNVKCPSEEKSTCKNKVRLGSCSLDDLKFKCYMILSSSWQDLVRKFFDRSFTGKSKVFIAFLCLWKSCTKTINENEVLKPLLCNSELLINLFVSSPPTDPMSLKIFLEVIIQSLSLEDSYLSYGRRQNEYQGGQLLINAINSGFLPNLPIGEYNSGFGGVSARVRCKKTVGPSMQQSCGKSTGTCDEIAVKKIVFIVLKILSASKISVGLLAAFWNTEAFLMSKIHLNTVRPAYLWILDFFFDQDDLLIDVLLCSLNLYINLESTDRIDVPSDDIIKLRNSLDPHKALLNFLQRIGGDHHVMLDFLISSDTYILHYLIQYLKLGLSEWEQFLSAHECVENCQVHSKVDGTAVVTSEANISDEECYSLVDDSDSSLKENYCSSSSPVPIATEKFQQVHLVSYSSNSSSSSDAELSPKPVTKSQGLCSCRKVIAPNWTISILANLRQALEKLAGCQEFPYRINPLTELLRKFENMKIM